LKPMKSILLVDVDAPFSLGVRKQLERFGYKVEHASSSEEACQRAREESFSLIMVELLLGKQDGIALVIQLRELKLVTPIVIYSSLDGEIYQTAALRLGADDYIVKSTSPDLLAHKIYAHLARQERFATGKAATLRRVSVGRFILDRHAHVLELEDKIVKLTLRETTLIDLLSKAASRGVPVRDLLDELWGPKDLHKSEKALHAMIKRLRLKLDKQCEARDLIENMHGRGFRISEKFMAHAA